MEDLPVLGAAGRKRGRPAASPYPWDVGTGRDLSQLRPQTLAAAAAGPDEDEIDLPVLTAAHEQARRLREQTGAKMPSWRAGERDLAAALGQLADEAGSGNEDMSEDVDFGSSDDSASDAPATRGKRKRGATDDDPETAQLARDQALLARMTQSLLPAPPPDLPPEEAEQYESADQIRSMLAARAGRGEDPTKTMAAATADERRMRQVVKEEVSWGDEMRALKNDLEGIKWARVPRPSESEARRHIGGPERAEAGAVPGSRADCALCRSAAFSNDAQYVESWNRLMVLYANSAPSSTPHETAMVVAAKFNDSTLVRCNEYIEKRYRDLCARRRVPCDEEELQKQLIAPVTVREVYDHLESHTLVHELVVMRRKRTIAGLLDHIEDFGLYRKKMGHPGPPIIDVHMLGVYMKLIAAYDAVDRSMVRDSFTSVKPLRERFVGKTKVT